MTRLYKRRRRRRILILLLATLLVGGFGLFGASRLQSHRQRAQLRESGMAALEQHHYDEAAQNLGRYVAAKPTDADAMYAYANAVRGLGFAEPGNLNQAIAALRHVRELQPGNLAASHDLLALYVGAGLNSEAVELATRVLQTHDDDAVALWNRAVAAVRLRRFKDALADSRRLNVVEPRNLDGQLLTIDLLHLTEVPAEQVVAAAQELRRSIPEPAAYALICGFAHQVTGDANGALELFKSAAHHAGADSDLVTRVVRLLDNAGAYDDSVATLQTAARLDPANLPIRRQLARRLDQADRPDLALALLDEPTSAAGDDSELLISRGIALLHLHRSAELSTLTQKLSDHTDSASRAWTLLFTSLLKSPPSTLDENLQLLRAQIPHDGADPMLRLMLGNALAASGKIDESLEAFQQASQLAPTWGAPHARRAELLLARGQSQPALDAVRMAFDRSPHSVPDAILLITAWSATLPDSGAPPTRLMELVEQVRRAAPQETRVLPALLGLYLRNQDLANAQKVIDLAAAADPAPAADVLIRLATLSRSAHLNCDRLLARCQQTHGLTPELALAQAISLSARNEKSKALAMLTPPPGVAGTQRRDWDIARLQFLEQTASPDSLTAWKNLARDYPTDRRILQALLSSADAWQDHALISDTLNRFKALAGATDLDYRIGRARLLLTDETTAASQSEAIALLTGCLEAAPSRVDLHLLLGQALLRANNTTGASQQLTQAAKLQPNSPDVCLAQAQLQADQGDTELARATLDHLLSLKDNTLPQLRGAATLLARLGLPSRAIDCLVHAYPGIAAPPDALLMYLYRDGRQLEKAKTIADALLAHPDPAGLEAAADFLGSIGQIPEAEKQLTRLDTFDLDPGLKELARARFAARYQGYDDALRHLKLAANEAPASSRVWNTLISHLLAGARNEDALAAASDASHRLPDEASLRFFLEHAGLVKELGAEPQARPLLLAMIREPDNQQAAVDALNILRSGWQGVSVATLASSIQPLANRQPQFLALGVLNVQLLLQAGRPDDAVTAATQLMRRFPDRAEPAAITAQALALANRWQESAAVAREWRARPDADRVDADVVIADSELRLGDARSALQTVAPYLPSAQADANRFMPVIVENARALLASGRVTEASNLLTPEMAKQPQWRKIWIHLAVESIHEPDAAAKWLKEIANQIPRDAINEQIELGRAWFLLGQQYKLDDFRDRSQSILQEATKDPTAGAFAFTSLAIVKNSRGDLTGAEQAYRKAADCTPPDPTAQNSLAVMLNRQGRDSAQALKLASAAVAACPQSSIFLDTLAQSQLLNSKPHDAIESWKKALALDPTNPGWHLRLAEAYVIAHDLPRARQTFEKAQLLAVNSSALPADFQNRLDQIRQQIVYARP